MAAREEAYTTAPSDTRAAAMPSWLARWVPVLALACAAGALFALRLDLPGFYDNEGRYAEVAREMLVRRDWLSPHLDFILFLNKPPLLHWLTALAFSLGGPSEWARLVSVAAAMATLVVTARLGARLYGEAVGLVAAVILATSIGFVLEARTLRPDGVLVWSVAAAVLCWHRAETAEGMPSTRWLVALYAVLGVGVLAKGLVPVVAAAIPIGLLTLQEHGWRGLGRLRPGLGALVLAAVVLPWHVLVALRHPGFAWDYVVNQHLLFFLDRKLPRDSEGDTLVFFWGALVGRAAPWILLVPLTAREALVGLRAGAEPRARATFLLWAWAGGLTIFFSCAPSRLEHYSLPALPALALLAARAWGRLRMGDVGRGAWAWLGAIAGAAALLGVASLTAGRALLLRSDWIREVPALVDLTVPAGIVLLGGGFALAIGVARRLPRLALGALALGAAAIAAVLLRAEVLAEPLFSWRPVARALGRVPAETEIVFEAPEEYQLVGGLAYYTGRRIALLEVPGFVPPTYLAGQVDHMFLPRAEFVRRWRSGTPLALVSDPQRHRATAREILPEPSYVLDRFGDRWVLTNFPVAR